MFALYIRCDNVLSAKSVSFTGNPQPLWPATVPGVVAFVVVFEQRLYVYRHKLNRSAGVVGRHCHVSGLELILGWKFCEQVVEVGQTVIIACDCFVPVLRELKTPRKSATHMPAMPNSSHMDPVPQSTPINRNRVVSKRVRTFPLW